MTVPVTAPPPSHGAPAAPADAGLPARRDSWTTPTMMRWLRIACFVTAALLGVALAYDATARLAQLGGAERAAELVVATQELRSALGEADGAAVNAFLAGGSEAPEQRENYLTATDEAAVALIGAGRAADGDEAVTAVSELQGQLPTYAGLIETARANNRQQLPLGAAYLRTASELVRTDIDEQIGNIRSAGDAAYQDDADGLLGGTGTLPLTALVLLLIPLLGSQYWLFRRTNRFLNAGLVAATLLLVGGLAVLNVVSQRSAQHALDATEAYDELTALSAIRSDAYDQQASSTFALVDRGARDRFNAEAATASQNVEARLAAVSLDATISNAWATYLAASNEVTDLDDAGDYSAARELAFEKPEHFETFDSLLTEQAAATTGVLTGRLGDARLPLRLIQFAGIPLGLAIGALAAGGIQQRLNDYR